MGAAAPPATLPTAPMQSAALHRPLSLTRPTQPFAFAGATPCRRHPYGVGHPPARLCLEGCLGHEAGVTEDMPSSRTISFETLASDSSSHGAR
jgi:hypothetical protein